MKRKDILLICLLLLTCLTFAACNNSTNDGNKKAWPSISYLSDAEKYIGAGKITYTTSFADGSNGIYINNATDTAVSAYRTQIENAGWTLAVGPVKGADNTVWGYTKGDSTCSIRLYTAVQTEERSSGNFSFNLYIGFENDSVPIPPNGKALSIPVVSINGNGLASWATVTDASGYKYKISDGAELSTQNTSVQLENGQSIQVKAIGDGTNHTDSAYSVAQKYTTSGSNPGEISVNDFDYQLGNNYCISSRWDVTGYDNSDNEYVYQEYRRIASINGVYFIETYDFNYENSNAQGNFAQVFYIPNGSDYSLYSRYDTNDEFELISSITTSVEFSNALSIALSETSITRAKQWCKVDTLQYVTIGATSTHSTGRTVKKYTYGASGTPLYDFYVDTQTKACLKFDDYVNDGHINLSTFSTSDNAYGSNGLPARPDGIAPEPIVLSVPVVHINQSGLASWAAVPNANSYKIIINGGTEVFATGMSEQLISGDTIQVKAVGNGETYSDSAFSAIQTYTESAQPTQLTTPIVTINADAGVASWVAVANATGYKYKINNNSEQTASSARSVTLSDGQSITVKAVGNGTSYTDSAYSEAKTYNAVEVSHTWPTSAKLTDYGFGSLAQPKDATLSDVYEATVEGQPCLGIVIDNGTDEMFNSLTTALYNDGANYGLNEGIGTVEEKGTINALKTITAAVKSFMAFKPTASPNWYYATSVEFNVTATTDTDGNPIAAGALTILLTKAEFTPIDNDPSFKDYITLPDKFTMTVVDGLKTSTYIKDGTKLYSHEYENESVDKEVLFIWETDKYVRYEKNNLEEGDYVSDSEFEDVYSVLYAMCYQFTAYADRMLVDIVFTQNGTTTVAGVTADVYVNTSGELTTTYCTYQGIVIKASEKWGEAESETTFEITTFALQGDLSGAEYSI